MIVVGIVGSPAGGKSTVAGILAELGGAWINADQVAREVLDEDEVQSQLIQHFGASIADEGGRIDRSRLAAKVFGDDDQSRSLLKYLESVIHPRTRAIITAQLRQVFSNDPVGSVVLLDIPLLFESNWDRCCDEVVCVDCSEAIRQERALARGWNAGELKRRETNQWRMTEKKRLSTFTINNDFGLSELRTQVASWYSRIMQNRSQTSLHFLPDHSSC
jgi:dephospho-CoA kinase